jgi:hypothetical protein
MSQVATSQQRLHDLDALRAAAMLIGIFYHVSLSFALGASWMVQDVHQDTGAFVFQAWVHGFRMQLFMLISGFFTAMLWRQKGLKALLWHRCRRVLFPCLLAVVTVVPAVNWAAQWAIQSTAAKRLKLAPQEEAAPDLWSVLKKGDLGGARSQLASGASLTNLHPLFAVTPLQWAALNGQTAMCQLLLDQGSPVDVRGRDGHTALHGAAFLGHPEIVELLLQRGADPNATSLAGETPLRSAEQDWGVVQYITGLLGISVDETRWKAGREQVVKTLREQGAKSESQSPTGPRAVWEGLTNLPVFGVIWFLWFLVWLVGLFAIYAALADRFGWTKRPRAWVLSGARLLWLVPLTLVPTWWMQSEFGPDTSMSVIPLPHVLLYYILFFFFGVFYFDCNDRVSQVGGSWRWSLPLTMLVIFPLALEFAHGTFGFRDAWLPKPYQRWTSVFLQSVFAWGMCFGGMGLFRALLTQENHTIRYLSDSSYWLYLAHLPLCIAGQAVVSHWPLPVWVKLPLLSLVLIAFLLLTYHFLVRYTWLGRLLNGPRKRPSASASGPGSIAAAA